MNKVLKDLVSLLDLETLEKNLFRGRSRDLGGKFVFGGQVLGQALVAASRTVNDLVPHSLHGYFLRGGDMESPIVYEVDCVRDGRHFSARRVQAIQFGRAIFTMIASFQQPEVGLEHQIKMPEVPPPESLTSLDELRTQWLERHRETLSERRRESLSRPLAIDFRPVNPTDQVMPEVRPAQQMVWFRSAGRLPDDPMLHRCVIAYASDFNLLSTALQPHGRSILQTDLAVASIDHALWFHRDARVDDWLLYAMDSPTAQGARGFSRGMIFTRDGRLVANVTQESLMRVHAEPQT